MITGTQPHRMYALVVCAARDPLQAPTAISVYACAAMIHVCAAVTCMLSLKMAGQIPWTVSSTTRLFFLFNTPLFSHAYNVRLQSS
jgi:hypothetical protein